MGKNNNMPFAPPLKILKASAGSGKTFSLTTYFLIFLFSGTKKYREILAVTFTNKATAEMKERVLSVLEGLAKGDSKFRGYQVYIKDAFPELSDIEIQMKAEIIFKDILHDYGRFSISTIDTFVQQVVRSFNFELGIEAGYRIEMNLGKVASDLSEILHNTLDKKPELLKWIIEFAQQKIANNERWEYQKALKRIANEIFTEDFQRFEAVIQEDQDDTLFPQLIQQAEKNVNDFEEKLIHDFVKMQDLAQKSNLGNDDFKGKSANYIGKLGTIREASIQTILNFYPKVLKYIDDFDEWLHPKSKNQGGLESLYTALNPILAESYNYYKEHYPDYQLAQLINGNVYYLRLIREMSTLLGAYRKDNSLLLISDASTLLSKINEGQEDNPSFIWEKVGNRYKHFLFDEFQDTSFGQWNNFLPIVKNALSESSGQRTEHLIVGDVKQSIYRWRGGDSRLLLSEIEENLGSFFVENDSLLENYRSSENIIHFNNLVFDSAPEWLQSQANAMVVESGEVLKLWQQMNYHNIITRSYQDSHQNPPKNVRKGGVIEVHEIPVENNRARGSQSKQEALQNTANALYRWIEVEKRYKASQIGILVRTGKDAVAIIDYLYKDQKRRENPHAYQVVSGSALLIANNDAISLLINALELLRSQPDAARIYKANCIQLYHQLQSQSQKIDKVISGEEWIQIKDIPLSKLTNFLPGSFCQKANELLQLPLSELIEQLVFIFDLSASTLHLPYLFSFRDSIAVFTSQGDKGLGAFLEWWYEECEKLFLPAEEGGDVVQVVTIHKSKGLAYDVVMLPLLGWEIGKAGREDNLWVELENTSFQQLVRAPLAFNSTMESSVLSKAYYEERLFRYMDALNEVYVALTRAKHHLFLNLIGQKKELEKSFIASDIIRLALEGKSDIPGLITQGEEVSDFVHEEDFIDGEDTGWSFESYPQSQHLKLQLNRETQKQLDALVQNKKQRLGILSHELLSRADSIEQVDRCLQEMHQEALLKQEELPEVRKLVIKVLQNDELQHLFSGNYQHLNEQDIIASGGMSYRPDKILLNEEEAIIVDFKFTEKIENAHREQIENYKHLLREMRIPVVKGYLFYGFMNQLILV